VIRRGGGFGPFFFILATFFITVSVLAEEPFEPGECVTLLFSQPIPESNVTDSVFNFYQEVLSINTIHRCPFYISCSYFAKAQLEKRGFFLGFLFFIDRYFYRENLGAFALYPLKQNNVGIYKLDDDYFIQD
jgi:hypothetical protein